MKFYRLYLQHKNGNDKMAIKKTSKFSLLFSLAVVLFMFITASCRTAKCGCPQNIAISKSPADAPVPHSQTKQNHILQGQADQVPATGR